MNLCILHVNNVSVLDKWKMLSFNAAEKTVMSFEIDISELILCFVPDLFMLYQPCLCTKKAIVHPLRYIDSILFKY